jgi:DNA replication protein DnaC
MSVEIIAELKELKLNGMASCYPELLAKARHSEFVPDTFMKQLIEAETAERTVRSMAYQMGAARFPTHRDLSGFDFSAAQAVPGQFRGQFFTLGSSGRQFRGHPLAASGKEATASQGAR